MTTENRSHSTQLFEEQEEKLRTIFNNLGSRKPSTNELRLARTAKDNAWYKRYDSRENPEMVKIVDKILKAAS